MPKIISFEFKKLFTFSIGDNLVPEDGLEGSAMSKLFNFTLKNRKYKD